MTDETEETCGDYGGETDDGNPCTRPAGWGREDADRGLCKAHNTSKDGKNEQHKKRFVEVLKSSVVSIKEAAREIGKSTSTIWRWRRDDEQFDARVEEAKDFQKNVRVDAVEDKVFQQIMNGEAAASLTIFWLKNRAGWRDAKQLEHTGRDGGPIQTDEVSEEDKQQLMDYTALFREDNEEDADGI